MHMERRKYVLAEIRMVRTSGMHFENQYNGKLDAWCLNRQWCDREEGRVTQTEKGLNAHAVMSAVLG